MEILYLKNIEMKRLKNAEHVQLHANVRSVIENADAEELGLSSLVYNPYRQAINVEQDIVNKATGSPYTIEMQQADEQRDRIFKRCRMKLSLCELEEPTTEAYKASPTVRKHLLDKYSGSVPSLPYQEESATITGFVLDCRNLLTSEQVRALGIDGDLDDLDSANQRFCRMYQERVTEKAEGDTQLSQKLRAATDQAYQLLSITLMSLANDPTEVNKTKTQLCRDCVTKINVVIQDAKNRLSQRLGSGAGEVGESETEGQLTN